MSIVLFEGVAGTGKTTELIKGVQTDISAHPLSEGQRVLALTKMHGSRKRMEVKLSNSLGLTRYADCITIDSFARNLVHRWRGFLQNQIGNIPLDGDFQSISSLAAYLLRQNMVRKWVSQRYPVILVDEMQDCKGTEIEIFHGLSAFSNLFCAADEFQDLSGALINEAVEWARTSGRIETLTKIHRTSDPFLLKSFLSG